jgi:hypothetical protein
VFGGWGYGGGGVWGGGGGGGVGGGGGGGAELRELQSRYLPGAVERRGWVRGVPRA